MTWCDFVVILDELKHTNVWLTWENIRVTRNKNKRRQTRTVYKILLNPDINQGDEKRETRLNWFLWIFVLFFLLSSSFLVFISLIFRNKHIHWIKIEINKWYAGLILTNEEMLFQLHWSQVLSPPPPSSLFLIKSCSFFNLSLFSLVFSLLKLLGDRNTCINNNLHLISCICYPLCSSGH